MTDRTPEQIQIQLESQRALDQRQAEKSGIQQQETQKESQKMGVMLFAILLILCVFGDLIDMLTLGTLGWLIGLFIDGILLLSTGLSKGGRKQFKKIVAGVVGDSIPILNILPFRSFFLTWSFVKSRYELPLELGLSGAHQKFTELDK